MTCEDIHLYTNKNFDNKLTKNEQTELDDHLEYCKTCKRTFESYKKLFEELNNITTAVTPPVSILQQLVNELQSDEKSEVSKIDEKKDIEKQEKAKIEKVKREKKKKDKNAEPMFTGKVELFWNKYKLIIALSVLIFFLGIAGIIYFSKFYSESTSPWQIISFSGNFSKSDKNDSMNSFYLDEKIITDAKGNVVIAIPELGKITLEPKTEIELVNDKENESRIFLSKGKVNVSTFKQQGHFSIETPNAIFVENLTNFSVEHISNGITRIEIFSGLLTVITSKDSFALPSKYMCNIITKSSYNVPHHTDAKLQLITGLKELDGGIISHEVIAQIVDASNESDALTLWHLLKRVNRIYRPRIIDKLNEFFPTPPKVTKEGVLDLNRKMLKTWWNEIIWQI